LPNVRTTYMYISIYITFRIRFSGSLFECFSRHVLTASIHRFVSANSFIFARTGTLYSFRLTFTAFMVCRYAPFYRSEETYFTCFHFYDCSFHSCHTSAYIQNYSPHMAITLQNFGASLLLASPQ
jgi:hypothetical protein